MDRQEEDRLGVEIVRLAYGRGDTDARVLNFTVRFHEPEGAAAACRVIEMYNSFDGEAVARAIEGLVLPDSSPLTLPAWSIGREQSPCIYVSHLGSGDAVAGISILLGGLLASEVEEVHDGAGSGYGRTVRGWWD